MKYFIDTEFIEYPCSIQLISVGIVSENGRSMYAENSEVDWSNASDWVIKNVKSKLDGKGLIMYQIKALILEFIGDDKPEFWGYYADYDWVVFCWIFGTMMELPKIFPMYCNDIKQLCNSLGNPQLPKSPGTEHNALSDAFQNKKYYEFLKENQPHS